MKHLGKSLDTSYASIVTSEQHFGNRTEICSVFKDIDSIEPLFQRSFIVIK